MQYFHLTWFLKIFTVIIYTLALKDVYSICYIEKRICDKLDYHLSSPCMCKFVMFSTFCNRYNNVIPHESLQYEGFHKESKFFLTWGLCLNGSNCDMWSLFLCQHLYKSISTFMHFHSRYNEGEWAGQRKEVRPQAERREQGEVPPLYVIDTVDVCCSPRSP